MRTGEISNDSLQRQRQVNQWSYQEKMETLFMFQLTFLLLMLLVITSSLAKMGLISVYISVLIGVGAAVILGFIWLFRYSFTLNIRDRREWNKRYFSGDYTKAPTISADALANAAKCKDT
jgi:protein-S-isoprenylcysteine O-methyltransferase Ste14